MKIPLTWLKDYLDINKPIKEIAASFTQLGLMLDKPLDESNVMDLEQRLNRSDLLSIIGCARDLAAFENIKLKLPKSYTKPGKPIGDKDKITIKVETPVVRRFQTRIIKGVKVADSPSWLTDRLRAYGMEPINNIVDITNFCMIEYGQPMHAQDIAKIPGRDITIRQANHGEKLTTLLGTELELTTNTHVLTSGGIPIVILGVVGGKQTGVTNSTVDIILDAGNYDSRAIRKSSRELKIMNETVTRDDKFLDPRLIDHALARATYLILQIAGGTYYTNDDYYPSPVVPQTMSVRMSRLKLLSGMDIDLKLAKKILKSLEYSITDESNDTLTVEVPYFRTDVDVEDDLVSDILRINNYDLIPLQPLSTPVPTDLTDPIYKFEDKLRDLLVAQGLHEHITNSLTTSNGKSEQVILANALSSDQNALRTHLKPGLLHVKSVYEKHKLKNIGIFEIGKVFRKTDKAYLEGRLLTVISDKDSLSTLLHSLGINNYEITKDLTIIVNDEIVGSVSNDSYTLVTNQIMKHISYYSGIISDFDNDITQDISLLVPSNIVYADIMSTLSSIKVQYKNIYVKQVTKMSESQNNYLLSLTWPAGCNTTEDDKGRTLAILKSKLKIESKS